MADQDAVIVVADVDVLVGGWVRRARGQSSGLHSELRHFSWRVGGWMALSDFSIEEHEDDSWLSDGEDGG